MCDILWTWQYAGVALRSHTPNFKVCGLLGHDDLIICDTGLGWCAVVMYDMVHILCIVQCYMLNNTDSVPQSKQTVFDLASHVPRQSGPMPLTLPCPWTTLGIDLSVYSQTDWLLLCHRCSKSNHLLLDFLIHVIALLWLYRQILSDWQLQSSKTQQVHMNLWLHLQHLADFLN